jgi:hypothetical protein
MDVQPESKTHKIPVRESWQEIAKMREKIANERERIFPFFNHGGHGFMGCFWEIMGLLVLESLDGAFYRAAASWPLAVSR